MALVDTHIALGSGIAGIVLAGFGVDPLVAIPAMGWAGYSSGAADIEPVRISELLHDLFYRKVSHLRDYYDDSTYSRLHFSPGIRALNPLFALHVFLIDPIFHKYENNWGKRYWWLDVTLRAFGYGATYISLTKLL